MKKENTSMRLKKIMNERGLKQVDILNLAKPYCKKYNTPLNKNDLSQYISGKIEPGQKKIMILAETLNVSPSWLMGLDVPMKTIEDNNNDNKMNDFLNSIEYNSIESTIKNDIEKKYISYVDFYDIILMIYPNKLNLVEEESTFFDKYLNNIESIMSEVKKININKNNIKINNSFNLSSLEDVLLSAKKNKLYYSIKKYYTKEDILKELNNRAFFNISDKNNNLITNEKLQLDAIEELVESILNDLLKDIEENE